MYNNGMQTNAPQQPHVTSLVFTSLDETSFARVHFYPDRVLYTFGKKDLANDTSEECYLEIDAETFSFASTRNFISGDYLIERTHKHSWMFDEHGEIASHELHHAHLVGGVSSFGDHGIVYSHYAVVVQIGESEKPEIKRKTDDAAKAAEMFHDFKASAMLNLYGKMDKTILERMALGLPDDCLVNPVQLSVHQMNFLRILALQTKEDVTQPIFHIHKPFPVFRDSIRKAA